MMSTITGVRGRPLPNLDAHGLARKMKAAHRLIEEQAELWRRANELGYERQRLEEEIKRAEHEHTRAWGVAMRAGEEAPSDEGVEAARRRLEEAAKESAAVAHASELADAELKQTVAEHAAEWDALVQERGEKILAEAQQMAAALSAKLAETEGLVGLHTWLESGGEHYTPTVAGGVSIDNLIHERMRALGLLDVGVVG